MFLVRILDFLVCKRFECHDDTETCVAWFDDIVDIAVACSIVRVAEKVVVFLFLLLSHFGAPQGPPLP